MGHRSTKEMAELFADAHSYSQVKFVQIAASRFGIDSVSAAAIHAQLMARSEESLLEEFDEVQALSPRDPKLPATDAIRALPAILAKIEPLKLTIVHAPTGTDFVLGDTPLPQSELARGFSMPISKSTATIAAGTWSANSRITRRAASVAEVEAINREQWNNALKITLGSNANTLSALL
jgi:hypothetical protein